MFKKTCLALSAAALTVSGSVMAEVPAEVTAAVTVLKDDGGAVIAAVGGALITLAGVVIVYKWAKAAFFG